MNKNIVQYARDTFNLLLGEHAAETIKCSVGSAAELDVPLDIAGLVEQLNIRARAAYGGSAGSPMVARLLETACGVDLRAPGFPATLDEYLATMPRAERVHDQP